MGTAAYNRGSRVITQQIDEQVTASERSRFQRSLLVECGKLRRENEALKEENVRLRAAGEKRGVYFTAERNRRNELAEEVGREHRSMMDWMRHAQRLTIQVKKLSAMLRMFTPEEVEDARQAARSVYPTLWSHQ